MLPLQALRMRSRCLNLYYYLLVAIGCVDGARDLCAHLISVCYCAVSVRGSERPPKVAIGTLEISWAVIAL